MHPARPPGPKRVEKPYYGNRMTGTRKRKCRTFLSHRSTTAYAREAGVRFPQNQDATPEPSSERISRSYRVSSFRGLPQSASPPMRNCLDFGWRNGHFKKRFAGEDLRRWEGARPRTAGGPKLIAAANHDLAAVVLTLRRLAGGAAGHRRLGEAIWSAQYGAISRGGAYRGRRGC
jgi:hypothetical protein